MRITPDTSILVRGNAKAMGPARELLHAVERTASLLVISPFILSEVERVLRYPRMQRLYGMTDSDIRKYLGYIESLADVIAPADGPRLVPNDPNDDPIVYTAIAGQADVICTIDSHFYDPSVLNFCARYRIRVMSDTHLLVALRESVA